LGDFNRDYAGTARVKNECGRRAEFEIEMGGRGHSQFVGSAGQYHVAYCLTVRGIHAAITLGNVPHVDIVAANSDGSKVLAIQVKTARWAHCSNRYGFELREWDVGGGAVGRSSLSLWYAFVDLQEDGDARKPVVFLVPSLWVGNFVQESWSRKRYMLRSMLWPECEERWDKVTAFFDGRKEVLDWCNSIPEDAKDWIPPGTNRESV
jgi:hypothetical protein